MGKKKKTLTGYMYSLGMHMIISHPLDSIERIDVGEKAVVTGPITTNSTHIIFLPELFGGIYKEGGIAGPFDVMFGGAAQAQNPYLVSQLGSDIPAFRGVVSIVLNRMYLAAQSPYIKPWQFLCKRIPAKTWYPAKADINGGSANAAHIIYDCFTNASWGLGYPSSVLDLASLTACADTLYAEGFGLSFILSNTDTIESFMQQVCKHVAATLSTDPVSGKFVMGLLRNDYTVGSLRLYDETNIIELQSYEKPAPAEMVNEVVVKFQPRGLSTADSVTAQDLASIQSQQGVISTTVDYTGIDTAANAARVASRELRQRSTPLTRVKFKANRSAWQEKIGGVIKFSWAAHRVANMVLRIVGINFGTLESGEIQITAIEDVFGLPYAQYIQPQPSQWVDPIQPASAISPQVFQELTYWEARRNFSDADFNALAITSGVAVAAAGAPSQASPGWDFYIGRNSTTYTFSQTAGYAPHALTTAAANRTQGSVTVGTVRGDLAAVPTGTYAKWGNELIRFDSYNSGTGVVTFGRGVIDTVPEEHASGTQIIFMEYYAAIDDTIFATSNPAFGKMLMRTASSLYPIASAVVNQFTVTGRAGRPYPPARFALSGGVAPDTTNVVFYGALNGITWNYRDRTQQLSALNDQNAGNFGPEVGTTTTIRSINVATSGVISTTNGLTGLSFDYSTLERNNQVPNVRLEAYTVITANGLQSFQNQTINVERHGLGFDLGDHLGGVP